MCQLCILKHKTKVYKETNDFIILDCMDCEIPMVVWKEHTMSLDEKTEELLEQELHKVATEFYQSQDYYIDKVQRKIFDHLHWHARNNDWVHE